MVDRETKRPSTGKKFLLALTAAAVAGIVVVWLTPMFLWPNLVVTEWKMDSPTPGEVAIIIGVHNDSTKSATGCVAYWELKDQEGAVLIKLESNGFWVPGNGDAVTRWGPPAPTFTTSMNSLPQNNWTGYIGVIRIECNTYTSDDWTSQW